MSYNIRRRVAAPASCRCTLNAAKACVSAALSAYDRRSDHAGYVEQFDTLLAELSVREMLMYTAELKRPVQVRAGLCTPLHTGCLRAWTGCRGLRTIW